MTPIGYRLWRVIRPVMIGAFLALCAVALFGCASEAQTAKSAATVAGGSAAGSLFGPVGAAVGGAVAYLFGAASVAQVVEPQGFLVRLAVEVQSIVWWCLAGYLLVLFLVPKSRDNLLSIFSRGAPLLDRLKSLLAGLVPSPHSPPAAVGRKVKREAKKAA